jgi:hypothetical protein
VKVIVQLPTATAVIVPVEPDTETVAIATLLEEPVYAVLPPESDMFWLAVGVRLMTVGAADSAKPTVIATVAVRELASVTVMVQLPCPRGVIVTVVDAIVAVATVESEVLTPNGAVPPLTVLV